MTKKKTRQFWQVFIGVGAVIGGYFAYTNIEKVKAFFVKKKP